MAIQPSTHTLMHILCSLLLLAWRILRLEFGDHLLLPRFQRLLGRAALRTFAHASPQLAALELRGCAVANGLHVLGDRALQFANPGCHSVLQRGEGQEQDLWVSEVSTERCRWNVCIRAVPHL